jgi:hypothetical protein
METQRLSELASPVNGEARTTREPVETLHDEVPRKLAVGRFGRSAKRSSSLGEGVWAKPRLSHTVTGITEATRRLRQSDLQHLLAEKECEGREKKHAP